MSDAFDMMRGMKFVDAHGHPLENCVDFIAVEAALKYYARRENWITCECSHGCILLDGDAGDVAVAVLRRQFNNPNHPVPD